MRRLSESWGVTLRPEATNQIGGVNIKGGGDPDNRVKRGRAFPQLEMPDVGPVDAGDLRETLLANWGIEQEPELTDAPSELDGQRLAGVRSSPCSCHPNDWTGAH
jgi:hypothetical protein